MYDSESTTFVQRIVLCCLVDLTADDRTPVDSAEIRERAKSLLEHSEDAALRSVSEADITRALNGLVGTDLIAEDRPDSTSPVGKGRPKYRLDVDADELRGELRDDEEAAALLA